MNITPIGHGRGWLDAPAAASIARIDTALGRPLRINSAGRTAAEQQRMIDLYNAGTPGIYGPIAPVGFSPHEHGRAIDTSEFRTLDTLLNEHGWHRPILPSDPVHYVYVTKADQHIDDPATTPAAPDQEENHMPKIMRVGDDILVVDHAQRTYWNIAVGMSSVPNAVGRMQWLIDQGAELLNGPQPGTYLHGYRDITDEGTLDETVVRALLHTLDGGE